jgi:hypothetical protein
MMIWNMFEIVQRTRVLVVLALAGFALCAFAAPVSAEEIEEGPLKRNGWAISVVPYVFAVSLDGTVGALGLEEEADVPFEDILKDLSAAAMLDFIVHKGRFGLFVNTLYAKLEDEGTASLLGGTILQTDLKLGATLKMLIMSFGAGYQLGPYPLGGQGGGRTPAVVVEPYVGGRWTKLDVDLDLTVTDVLGSRSFPFEDDTGWADPIFGVMTQWNLYPRWNLTFGGDVGGFGVGTDLAWSAIGLAGYRFHFSKRIMGNVLFGYRALYQDFQSDNPARFKFDTTLHGPFLGVSIQFGQWYKIK